MTIATLDLDVSLKLHPLTYLDEGDEVTVGRPDINSYGLFPPDAAALLRRLEAGYTPNDSARWYAHEYGETVDITDFLEILEEYEMLVKDGETVAEAKPVRWQRLGRAAFSPPAWAAYAAVTIAAVVAMVRDHALVPGYQNLFFTRDSLVILTLGIVLGQLPWIMIHEAYHALAGRRLGLNSTMRIGRRLYYVVFVTTMDGLVAVPRRKRYLPMLSGMMIDVPVFAVLTVVAAPLLSGSATAQYAGRFLLAMAFGVVLRVAWQFYFFLRTDLYYLITTVVGCNDLQTVARQQLQNHWFRLIGRGDRLVDPNQWQPRDAAIARWYSWLMLTGYLFLGGTLLFVGLPTGFHLTELAFRKLGSSPTPLDVADVIFFLILNFGELVVAAVLAGRGYLRRKRRPALAQADLA
jgi:hypothetical protein